MTNPKSFVSSATVRTVLLFVLLLVIGLVTRFPAKQFVELYALHGVLAAPFCAALAQWHFTHSGGIVPLIIATLGLALFLGMMSPIMGLGFLLLAGCTLAAYAVLSPLVPRKRDGITAAIFGLLNYPCTLMAGIVLGSYMFTTDALLTIAIMLCLSIMLAFFGVLVVPKPQS